MVAVSASVTIKYLNGPKWWVYVALLIGAGFVNVYLVALRRRTVPAWLTAAIMAAAVAASVAMVVVGVYDEASPQTTTQRFVGYGITLTIMLITLPRIATYCIHEMRSLAPEDKENVGKRSGLGLIAAGSILGIIRFAIEAVAVVAQKPTLSRIDNVAGHFLDAIAAGLLAIGAVVLIAAPWVRNQFISHRDAKAIQPLWEHLTATHPQVVLSPSASTTRKVIEVHDALALIDLTYTPTDDSTEAKLQAIADSIRLDAPASTGMTAADAMRDWFPGDATASLARQMFPTGRSTQVAPA